MLRRYLSGPTCPSRKTETRLDCTFNNVGIGGRGALTHEYGKEEWNRVLAVNLTGVWLCV